MNPQLNCSSVLPNMQRYGQLAIVRILAHCFANSEWDFEQFVMPTGGCHCQVRRLQFDVALDGFVRISLRIVSTFQRPTNSRASTLFI